MSTLQSGEQLNVNQSLLSDNGAYALVMQSDGNLVLYGGQPSLGNAVWATDTWNLPPAMRPVTAIMQGDGNFVLYSAVGQPIWASGTDDNPGSRLVMQDDRNLVIYDPANRPIWATMTNIPVPAKRTGEVVEVKNDEVGWGKKMETTATLYRDGRLVVDSFTKNDNWTGGMRGRTLVVVVDAQGYNIWLSNIFEDPTRCSVPDVSCASYGRLTHIEQFPAVVGQYAERLDIYHGDTVSYVDLRNRLIDAIKQVGEVAQELKNEWDKLQKT